MKFLRSIRFRLVVLYWLLSNALLLIAMGIMYYRLYVGFKKITHIRVREDAYDFITGGYSTREGIARFVERTVAQKNRAAEKPWLFFCACDSEGRVIVRSSHVPPGHMLASKEGFERARAQGKWEETVHHVSKYPVRCRSIRITLDDGTTCIVQIGLSRWREVKTLSNLRKNIHIALAGFAVVSLLLGFTLVKWSFDPVKRITTTAQSITAHDLSRRIPASGAGDEIDDLAAAFNAMIARIEESFDKEKQFSADASHELKTPIATMRGQIELALESERSAEEYRQVLTSGLEEINRLRAIVDSLLLLARHDSPDTGPRREPVPLSEVLEEIRDIGQSMADDRRLTFCAAGIDTAAHVLGNRQNLERLFLNLVENAARYNKPGGSISVELRVEDETAIVEVKDVGRGIPDDELPLVFNRFYRGKQARAEAGGVGLGLSLCKAIVQEHGGEISAESKLGRGSTFTVRLPVTQGER